MTTGLGATFTIEGNPGKDGGCWGCLGMAKPVLLKLVVLTICAVVLAMVNPRMVGFISLCILHLSNKTLFQIALELRTRWEDHEIFNKTQHVGSIT